MEIEKSISLVDNRALIWYEHLEKMSEEKYS